MIASKSRPASELPSAFPLPSGTRSASAVASRRRAVGVPPPPVLVSLPDIALLLFATGFLPCAPRSAGPGLTSQGPGSLDKTLATPTERATHAPGVRRSDRGRERRSRAGQA